MTTRWKTPISLKLLSQTYRFEEISTSHVTPSEMKGAPEAIKLHDMAANTFCTDPVACAAEASHNDVF